METDLEQQNNINNDNNSQEDIPKQDNINATGILPPITHHYKKKLPPIILNNQSQEIIPEQPSQAQPLPKEDNEATENSQLNLQMNNTNTNNYNENFHYTDNNYNNLEVPQLVNNNEAEEEAAGNNASNEHKEEEEGIDNNDNNPSPCKYSLEFTSKDLKKLVLQKNSELISLSNTQDTHKKELCSLLSKLNSIIGTAAGILYAKPADQEKLSKMEYLLSSRHKEYQRIKAQNNIYKLQLQHFTHKIKGISMENITELQTKIDCLQQDNTVLTKKMRELKNRLNVKSKVLEGYSANVKFPREIKSYTEEVKALSTKKHEYFLKLNHNKKVISNFVLQIEKLEELHEKMKTMTNLAQPLPTAKIHYEINRIKYDLKGNEDDIIKRIDNEEMMIIQEEIRKQQMMSPSGNSNKKLLKPMIANGNISVGRNLTKSIHIKHRKFELQRPNPIQLKSQSPKGRIINDSPKGLYSKGGYNPITRININATALNTQIKVQTIPEAADIYKLDEQDLSKITYESLTDYEYREILNKKEHYYDIILKLENSIKEARKMYDRKLKEMNFIKEQNSKKLSNIEQENELLKSEINDLSKITMLNNEVNQMKKEIKESSDSKIYKPYNINNDVSDTRNDILNDLNFLNNPDGADYQGKDGKYTDILTDEDIEDKQKKQREQALNDIKKRYIKVNKEDIGHDYHFKEEDEEDKELLKDDEEDINIDMINSHNLPIEDKDYLSKEKEEKIQKEEEQRKMQQEKEQNEMKKEDHNMIELEHKDSFNKKQKEEKEKIEEKKEEDINVLNNIENKNKIVYIQQKEGNDKQNWMQEDNNNNNEIIQNSNQRYDYMSDDIRQIESNNSNQNEEYDDSNLKKIVNVMIDDIFTQSFKNAKPIIQIQNNDNNNDNDNTILKDHINIMINDMFLQSYKEQEPLIPEEYRKNENNDQLNIIDKCGTFGKPISNLNNDQMASEDINMNMITNEEPCNNKMIFQREQQLSEEDSNDNNNNNINLKETSHFETRPSDLLLLQQQPQINENNTIQPPNELLFSINNIPHNPINEE